MQAEARTNPRKVIVPRVLVLRPGRRCLTHVVNMTWGSAGSALACRAKVLDPQKPMVSLMWKKSKNQGGLLTQEL
jgi:hypothetical protein